MDDLRNREHEGVGGERECVSDEEHLEFYVGCRVECMLMEGPSPVATHLEQLERQRDPSLSCVCIHRWP